MSEKIIKIKVVDANGNIIKENVELGNIILQDAKNKNGKNILVSKFFENDKQNPNTEKAGEASISIGGYIGDENLGSGEEFVDIPDSADNDNLTYDKKTTSVAAGDFSINFGSGNRTWGKASFAVGNANVTKGKRAIAFGNNCRAIGDNSCAIGVSAETTSENSLAFINGISNGSGCIAIGRASGYYDSNNTNVKKVLAKGINSVAIGNNAVANGNTNISIGQYNLIGCYVENGELNEISVAASVAIGANNTVKHNYCYAIGMNIATTATCQVLLGYKPTAQSNDRFVIGKGSTGSNRQNLFVIKDTGAGYLPECIPEEINSDTAIITKKWADDKLNSIYQVNENIQGYIYDLVNVIGGSNFNNIPMVYNFFTSYVIGNFNGNTSPFRFTQEQGDERKYTGLSWTHYQNGFRKWYYNEECFEYEHLRNGYGNNGLNCDIEYTYSIPGGHAAYYASSFNQDIATGIRIGKIIIKRNSATRKDFNIYIVKFGTSEKIEITTEFTSKAKSIFMKKETMETMIQADTNLIFNNSKVEYIKEDYALNGSKCIIKASLLQCLLIKVNPEFEYIERKIVIEMQTGSRYYLPSSGSIRLETGNATGGKYTSNYLTYNNTPSPRAQNNIFYTYERSMPYVKTYGNVPTWIRRFYVIYTLENGDLNSCIYRGRGFDPVEQNLEVSSLYEYSYNTTPKFDFSLNRILN